VAKYKEFGEIRPADPNVFSAFGREIQPGEVVIFTAASLMPSGIPWGGRDCQAVAIGASSTGGSPIYIWQAYRPSQDFSQPHKTDVARYYPDGRGRVFSQHIKPAGFHHNHNVTQTGLAGLAKDNHLPTAVSAMSVAEFRGNGACIIFF
jgi:hypothetical protein